MWVVVAIVVVRNWFGTTPMPIHWQLRLQRWLQQRLLILWNTRNHSFARIMRTSINLIIVAIAWTERRFLLQIDRRISSSGADWSSGSMRYACLAVRALAVRSMTNELRVRHPQNHLGRWADWADGVITGKVCFRCHWKIARAFAASITEVVEITISSTQIAIHSAITIIRFIMLVFISGNRFLCLKCLRLSLQLHTCFVQRKTRRRRRITLKNHRNNVYMPTL